MLLSQLSSFGAAIVVAEHTLPSNATSWFNVGAGIGTDGAVFDNRQAQTFVPTASGYLTDVSFDLYRIGTSADLRISITTVMGGQPAATLDSVLLPFAAVGTNSLSSSFLLGGTFSHTVQTSGTQLLYSGVTYALVFSSDTTEANYQIYGDNSGYVSGTNLRFQNSGPFKDGVGSDLLFRVTAVPIPEPHMGLLGVPAVLLLVLRRSRSRTSR